MRFKRQSLTTAAVALLAMATLGCASLPDKSAFADKDKPGESKKSLLDRLPLLGASKHDEQPEPYPNPVKLLTTWTPDTLLQTGRTPTRGFGGRVFFYDEKSRPVPVEGTLTVHGFDDGAPNPENSVKRFEFTPEQFTRHYSQCDLGASYSIWIPWDAVGGPQRRVSLVTSFKTAEGDVIQGIPATLALPGKSQETENDEELATFADQYLKHLAATESTTTRQSGLTTTTIARSRGGLPVNATTPKTNIVKSRATPSLDLKAAKRPPRSGVVPASAQMPLE